MGTTCGFKTRAAAISYCDELLPGYTMEAVEQIGECRWMLIVRPDGIKAVCLALVRPENNAATDWGVKFIGDDMGPTYYTCPLAFIEAADATGPGTCFAPEWRQKVRAHRAAQEKALLDCYRFQAMTQMGR